MKQALARQLGKMKAKSKGGGSSGVEYAQHYESLLDKDDDPNMKI